MKKVEKTTRPFRYDLNQIPYDYLVEVRNRFKGLDLIDRVPDELRTEVCDIVHETKSSRAKANRVFLREYTGHSKHPLPTTEKITLHMDLTRWSK